MKIRLFFTLILMGVLSQATPVEAMFKSKTSKVLAIGGSAVALAGLSAVAINESFRNKCNEMIEQAKSEYYDQSSNSIDANDTRQTPLAPLPRDTILGTHLGMRVSLTLTPQTPPTTAPGSQTIRYDFTTDILRIPIYNTMIILPAPVTFTGEFLLQ